VPVAKAPVDKKIYHLNTLQLYPAQTRKRTKKELPNSYIKLLNYRHPIVRFLQKTRVGPDQSHYNQSRLWSRLQTALALITRITLKWIHTVLKIFSPFTIFEQLALALKTEFALEFFHCIEYLFYHLEFLSNFAHALKNRVAVKIFTVLNMLLHSGVLTNLRLAWKTEQPWTFSLNWNIFIIQDFWATSRWPWKTVLLWNFSLYWINFLHSGVLQLVALKNTGCLEFTLLNIYFLLFRIFEQLVLALKTEFALKFFTVYTWNFSNSGRRMPPPTPASYAYASLHDTSDAHRKFSRGFSFSGIR